MSEELITIREMSQICKVSKRTLRYYDVIGLIKPAHVNRENGYRFYEPYQVVRVLLVKQMQELGISLGDVSFCVKEKGTEINIDEFFNHISKRELDIKQEMKTLLQQRKMIRDYISQYESIKEKLNNNDMNVHIEYIDRRYLISKRFIGESNKQMFGRTFIEIGRAMQDLIRNNYELLPKIGRCFYGEHNDKDCINHIGFYTDKKIVLSPFQLVEIDEGFYASYRYVGEYNKIDKQYAFLYQYLKGLNYCIKDFRLEIFHLSTNISLKESEYITEIQIPIYSP